MAAIVLSELTSDNFEVMTSKRDSEVQGQNPHWSAFQSHPEMIYRC